MIFKIGSIIDISKPPLGPPLRKMKCGVIFDYWDIVENKKELDAWHRYLEEYRDQLKVYRNDSI